MGVHDRLHVVDPVAVHGDAHRPYEHGGAGTAHEFRETLHRFPGCSRGLLELFEALRGDQCFNILPPGRVRGNELAIHSAAAMMSLVDRSI